jgi:hypothetical protein
MLRRLPAGSPTRVDQRGLQRTHEDKPKGGNLNQISVLDQQAASYHYVTKTGSKGFDSRRLCDRCGSGCFKLDHELSRQETCASLWGFEPVSLLSCEPLQVFQPRSVPPSVLLACRAFHKHPFVDFSLKPANSVGRNTPMTWKLPSLLEPPNRRPRQAGSVSHNVKAKEFQRKSLEAF